MELRKSQIEALREAEAVMVCCDFCPYLDLKALLRNGSAARRQFEPLFTTYYRLNLGRVTPEFKRQYFDILYNPPVGKGGAPDIGWILHELGKSSGGKLHFSFVSKLANIHCDTSPICDSHVMKFIGQKYPKREPSEPDRIAKFLRLLKLMAKFYDAWAATSEVAGILENLKRRNERLAGCSDIRLLDFLIWKAGRIAVINQ